MSIYTTPFSIVSTCADNCECTYLYRVARSQYCNYLIWISWTRLLCEALLLITDRYPYHIVGSDILRSVSIIVCIDFEHETGILFTLFIIVWIEIHWIERDRYQAHSFRQYFRWI